MTCYIYKNRRKGKIRDTWRGRYRFSWMPKIKEVSLKTKDKQVAEKLLNDLVQELEREHAGIIDPKPLRDAAQADLRKHLDDYVRDLEQLGRDRMYVYNVEKLVLKLLTECKWVYPKDVTPDSFQTWRGTQAKAPKTLNEYLYTMRAFINWMVLQRRLIANPLLLAQRVETRGRDKRKRRASTEDELRRLLSIAGPRRPVYLFALFTGLRRGEIVALLWSDIFLNVAKPFIKARASTTKNHLDAVIWLHGDLVEVLRTIRPENVLPDDSVFPQVPSMYMLKKDLAAAGIPYKDRLGRQADFHSLRHTFGTNLSLAGVLPRVAMELMRHSDLRLTMKVYTDATQLPSADGIDRLPSLIKTGPHLGPHTLGATCHDLTLDGTGKEQRPVGET